MKIALFYGTNSSAGLTIEIGTALTKAAQFGEFGNIAHVAAIHEEYGNAKVLLASSTMAHGVCLTIAKLNPKEWYIYDVPSFDLEKSKEWFSRHLGEPYDVVGAVESILPWHHSGRKGWYCNEAVAASVGVENYATDPEEFSELVARAGVKINNEFFANTILDTTGIQETLFQKLKNLFLKIFGKPT